MKYCGIIEEPVYTETPEYLYPDIRSALMKTARKQKPHALPPHIPVLTGAAVPLGALKTEHSCGCGEYPDLMAFADFCAACSLELIQLLPVNDTGTDSSPYSALSAFALHPLYISIDRLPEFQENTEAARRFYELKQSQEPKPRFNYTELRRAKLEILRMIYEANAGRIADDKALNDWIRQNDWVAAYAVFMRFKALHNEASWKSWEAPLCTLSSDAVQAYWNDGALRKEHLFFAWMQLRAAEQFAEAAAYVRSRGIILKGDIPIMMNEDSCDAWANPQFFNDGMRAGAPPDGPNPDGQNWGFPVYNWKELAKDGYSWWKNRLVQAAQYYGAYRIDHVLGFFRIWQTPEREVSASMGRTEPDAPITAAELHEIGFTPERIHWLCEPHVPTREIEAVNNNDYLGTHGLLHTVMDRIGTEELWLFKKSIRGERDIYGTQLPEPVKKRLASFWRDRALRETGKNKYTVQWTYRDSTAWRSLSEQEKELLQALIDEKNAAKEKKWEKQARTLLAELTGAADMIACAEDLGANPESVPRVLSDLSILGLRVIRWTRSWGAQGQPYVPFDQYPPLSVTATSVHDSSTLRLWWLTEQQDAKAFCRDFSTPDSIQPGVYTPQTAQYLLEQAADSHSAFCIHPIQDFLSLSARYSAQDPGQERVNIPGQVTPFNWTYRIPQPIETLCADDELTGAVKDIAVRHKNLEKILR